MLRKKYIVKSLPSFVEKNDEINAIINDAAKEGYKISFVVPGYVNLDHSRPREFYAKVIMEKYDWSWLSPLNLLKRLKKKDEKSK